MKIEDIEHLPDIPWNQLPPGNLGVFIGPEATHYLVTMSYYASNIDQKRLITIGSINGWGPELSDTVTVKDLGPLPNCLAKL